MKRQKPDAEEDPQATHLFNWYFAGTILDCKGSVTAIKAVDVLRREVVLPFRDDTVRLSFENALKYLKEPV